MVDEKNTAPKKLNEREQLMENVSQEAANIIGRNVVVSYEATIREFTATDGRVSMFTVETDEGARYMVPADQVRFPDEG